MTATEARIDETLSPPEPLIEPVDTAPAARLVDAPPTNARAFARWRSITASVAWGLFGVAVFVALWQLATVWAEKVPSATDTFSELRTLLAHAFAQKGSSKGIGIQLQGSLGRVFKGFGLATVVGIPLGLLLGTSKRAWQAFNPIVQLLRPVSPLAWFPIWLVVFRDSPKAAVFVIFITALWPIVLNTAAGAASVPQDHRNVARVFRFGRIAYVRHVLIPDALPNIITGLRLSMGVAWMVIVAVEMLSASSGIGFYVWDAYNASNLAGVTSAIVIIGVVGLVLDMVFLSLGRYVAREN
ncbi:MAG TPA: nitrate ABC transporter permease [Acidimicrobiales bacterium]|jgi:nitrate/nitrite transport system permease protein|nr:nitrate ABC transporter permease [Acidimicrobiales bacterium]